MRDLSAIRGFLLLALFLGLISLAAVSAQTPKTLVIGTTDVVGKGGLEPADNFDFYGFHVLQQTHEGLCTLEPGTARVIAELAESCDPADVVSDDGLTYTFKLRSGITFTDGTPLTAANVVYSFKRNLALGGDPTFLIAGVEDVKALDDLTVQIKLKKPDATFLSKIAGTNPAFILSFNSVTKDASGNDVPVDTQTGELQGTPDLTATEAVTGTDPQGTIGTGPYILVQYVPGQLAVFQAYGDYWGCKVTPQFKCPNVPQVIERHFNTSPSLSAALQDGSVDIAWRGLNIPDIKALEGNPQFVRFQPPGSSSIRYINFDVAKAPYDDLRVRKAIALAVDRSAITTKVFEGVNQPIFSMVPAGFPGHVDVFPNRDVAQASGLLQQAGYSADNPLTVDLWFETSGHYGTTEPDVAAVIKDSLEEVPELRVNLQPIDFPGLIRNATEDRTANFFLLGWFPDFLDPLDFLDPFIGSGTNDLGIFFGELTDKGLDLLQGSNTEQYLQERGLSLTAENIVKLVNDLIEEATVNADPAVREEAFRKLQQIEADVVPQIPLWGNTSRFITLAQQNISGIVQDASLWLRDWLIQK